MLCDKNNAKRVFWLNTGSFFDIKNPSQNHVFTRHLPAHYFCKFYVDFIRKWSMWETLQNLAGAKMGPKLDQAAPNYLKIHDLFPPWRVCFATCVS